MFNKTVIPAKAGIQNVRELYRLDSGSPLRSTRNDDAFGLSKCHSGRVQYSENVSGLFV